MKYIAPRDTPATEEDPTPPYIDENPAAGISGSVVGAEFFNTLQEEILNVITGDGADLVPAAGNHAQLYEAILALIETYAPGGGGGGGGPYALAARQIIAGLGLSGGGDLSADRTLAFAPSELTAETTLDDADGFVFNKASVPGPRLVTWGIFKALIAAAVAGSGGSSIPAIDGIGSTIMSNMQGLTTAAAGTIVAGTTLSPTRPGNWRCQGFQQILGVVIDQNSGSSQGGGLGYASFRFGLFIRIS